jgi:GxxExxY protein
MDQNEITRTIIGCAYTIQNSLGNGFLEKVYENALVHELKKAGMPVDQQKEVRVVYDGIKVGEYFADIIVGNSVIVELKAVRALDEVHMAQCLNYLKATGLKICLLINFGRPRLQIKHFIY